jgi:hypothetical protein
MTTRKHILRCECHDIGYVSFIDLDDMNDGKLSFNTFEVLNERVLSDVHCWMTPEMIDKLPIEEAEKHTDSNEYRLRPLIIYFSMLSEIDEIISAMYYRELSGIVVFEEDDGDITVRIPDTNPYMLFDDKLRLLIKKNMWD